MTERRWMQAALEARGDRDAAEAERDALRTSVDFLQAQVERLARVERAARAYLDAISDADMDDMSVGAAEDALRIAIGGDP